MYTNRISDFYESRNTKRGSIQGLQPAEPMPMSGFALIPTGLFAVPRAEALMLQSVYQLALEQARLRLAQQQWLADFEIDSF